jgi:hypothetical protein
MEISLAIVILLVILLLLFSDQFCHTLNVIKKAVLDKISCEKSENLSSSIVDDDAILDVLRTQPSKREHMQGDASLPDSQVSDVLTVLGYTGDQPWQEVVKVSELDPSTFANHNEFVKDVRRFSSGANFTSVQDDNTNAAFTNFVGLRRPTHVPIGATARQQPDVEQGVLSRNKRFDWSGGPNFSERFGDAESE